MSIRAGNKGSKSGRKRDNTNEKVARPAKRPTQPAASAASESSTSLAFPDVVKRRLEQVRHARDYADAIVETISEPLLILDSETRVLTANASFYQVFRTSAEETVGRSIFELGDRQWNIPQLRQLLTDLLPQDSRIEDFAMEHDVPAIGLRHILVNARQLHHAGVGTGMVLLAIKDLTATVEARQVIEESEATTRALLESASQGILAIDRNGTIRVANRMTETMFGYSREELLGHPLAILLPERFRQRHDVHRVGFFSGPRARRLLRFGHQRTPTERASCAFVPR
jgi:PAS domain-containing protein